MAFTYELSKIGMQNRTTDRTSLLFSLMKKDAKKSSRIKAARRYTPRWHANATGRPTVQFRSLVFDVKETRRAAKAGLKKRPKYDALILMSE